MDNISFVTDRLPPIVVGIKNVFQMLIRIFSFHLLQNIRAWFGKIVKTKGLFWEVDKAYKTSKFDDAFNKFSRFKPREGAYLNRVTCEKWSITYLPMLRYSYKTSSTDESVNSLSKDARKMHVTTLLEFFRAIMQRWFFECKSLNIWIQISSQ